MARQCAMIAMATTRIANADSRNHTVAGEGVISTPLANEATIWLDGAGGGAPGGRMRRLNRWSLSFPVLLEGLALLATQSINQLNFFQ